MAEYIKRDAFVAWLKRIPLKDLSDGRGLCRIIMEEDFKRAIKELPREVIADVAPVVRCKDCLYWEAQIGFCHQNSQYYNDGESWDIYQPNEFCSRGERRNA